MGRLIQVGYTHECHRQRRLLVVPLAAGRRDAQHRRPCHQRKVARKQRIRMQRVARMLGVHGRMLFRPLVAARRRSHCFHPGDLDVRQGAGLLQKLAGRRFGEHIAVRVRVVDQRGANAGQHEHDAHCPGEAAQAVELADAVARFAAGGFVLGALRVMREEGT